MATSNPSQKGVSTGQVTLWNYALSAAERAAETTETCENGHEFCCGIDGIHFSDDGETIEHEGRFPCFDCFMEAHRREESA
jgi:hypothetical protein